jgi:hypothetical protein
MESPVTVAPPDTAATHVISYSGFRPTANFLWYMPLGIPSGIPHGMETLNTDNPPIVDPTVLVPAVDFLHFPDKDPD